MASKNPPPSRKGKTNPGRTEGLNLREEMYCQWRAAGKTQAVAAALAGYSERRGAATGTELERRAHVRARIAELVREEVMPAAEIRRRLSLQAAGLLATKVVTGGRDPHEEYDTKGALQELRKLIGMDAPKRVNLSADEAIAQLAKVLGLPAEELRGAV